MEAIDVPAILYVGSQIVVGIVVVVTLRNDIKWIKKWMHDHSEEDKENFKDLRQRLGQKGL